MSIIKKVSIFNREFRKNFNANKYQNYTARQGDNLTHLPFYSVKDIIVGRTLLTFGIVVMGVTMWVYPEYLHETLRHFEGPPSHDRIDGVLKGREKRFNQQLIHREHEEKRLEHFMDQFKSY